MFLKHSEIFNCFSFKFLFCTFILVSVDLNAVKSVVSESRTLLSIQCKQKHNQTKYDKCHLLIFTLTQNRVLHNKGCKSLLV